RIDHVFDRFVRHNLLDLVDDRSGAGVVLRSFDHHQMVGHLDQYAVMSAARQVPYTIGDLVGLDLDSRLTNIVWHLDIYWRIGFDLAYRKVKSGEAARFLRDLGRKLNTAKIRVVSVAGLCQSVAEHRVGAQGFD